MGEYNSEVENAFLTLVNDGYSYDRIPAAIKEHANSDASMSDNIQLKRIICNCLDFNRIELSTGDYRAVRLRLIDYYIGEYMEKDEKPVDKFADLKAEFEAGKDIQYLSNSGDWCDGIPEWFPNLEYRIKPKPVVHKHQECIDAYKRGAQIEYFDKDDGTWCPASTPTWSLCREYRVKPTYKYQAEKEAFEKGIDIEYYNITQNRWLLSEHPDFFGGVKYRIKPETSTFKHKEYSLGFSATKQAIDELFGETKMMNFDNKAVEPVVPKIFGVPSDEVTDATIFSVIKQLEDSIAAHDEIKNKPTKLKDEIKKLEGQIDELVKFVDSRD